jgi:hypothetical protein
MSDGIVVIEAEHFATEQAELMTDNGIIDMAGGLYYDANAPKGQALLDWLDSWEGISTAQRIASQRGIRFQSIGGPARAIRALVVMTQEAEVAK